MNIFSFFKNKCLASGAGAHTATSMMYSIPYIELRQRNEERLIKAKEQMGELYILHPVHNIKRKVNI